MLYCDRGRKGMGGSSYTTKYIFRHKTCVSHNFSNADGNAARLCVPWLWTWTGNKRFGCKVPWSSVHCALYTDVQLWSADLYQPDVNFHLFPLSAIQKLETGWFTFVINQWLKGSKMKQTNKQKKRGKSSDWCAMWKNWRPESNPETPVDITVTLLQNWLHKGKYRFTSCNSKSPLVHYETKTTS